MDKVKVFAAEGGGQQEQITERPVETASLQSDYHPSDNASARAQTKDTAPTFQQAQAPSTTAYYAPDAPQRTTLIDISQYLNSNAGSIEIRLRLATSEQGALTLASGHNVTVDIDAATGALIIRGNAEAVQQAMRTLMLNGEFSGEQVIIFSVKNDALGLFESHAVRLDYNAGDNSFTPSRIHQSGNSQSSDLDYIWHNSSPTTLFDMPEMPPLYTPHQVNDGLMSVAFEEGPSSPLETVNTDVDDIFDTTNTQPTDNNDQNNGTTTEPETPTIPVTPPETQGIHHPSLGKIDVVHRPGAQTDVAPPEAFLPPIPPKYIRTEQVLSNQTYTEENAEAITQIALDSADGSLFILLRLTEPDAGSLNTPTVNDTTAIYDAATGVWSAIGNQEDVNAVLAQLVFTPSADYDQDVDLMLTATNSREGYLARTITLQADAIQDAVQLSTALVDRTVQVGASLNEALSSFFSDPDTGEVLTYSAELTNGNPLPGWMSLNNATGLLSGSPVDGDQATYSVRVTVTDSVGNTAQDEVDITVADGLTATNRNQNLAYTEDITLDLQNMVISSATGSATVTITFSDPTSGIINSGNFGSVTISMDDVSGVWQASGAVASLNQVLASAAFAPSDHYNGNMTATVTISDGANADLSGTLIFTGAAVEDDPTLKTALQDQITGANDPFTLTAAPSFDDPDVITDGDNLTYTATLTNGNPLPAWLSLNAATGVFSGTPAPGDLGSVDIRLTVTDSTARSVTDDFTVTVVNGGLIIGTINDDFINGSGNADEIYGLQGLDTLKGSGGNDLIYGAQGRDLLSGGAQNDTLDGGDDDDLLDGGANNDSLLGGDGNDLLGGGTGNDELFGNDGDDRLYGNAGRDTMTGGAGDDIFAYGQASDSTVANPDTIENFTIGNDRIDLSLIAAIPGFASLTITPGATTTIAHSASGLHIELTGNLALTATDFIFASQAGASDLNLEDESLAIGDAFSLDIPAGLFASIDDGNLSYTATLADGSLLSDWLAFNPNTAQFSGTAQAGDDGLWQIVLRATNGAGTIAEERFNIAVNDTAQRGTGGGDNLSGAGTDDAIVGRGNDDTIIGGNGTDILTGGSGNDTLDGGNHDDTLHGGDGNDSITGNLRRDLIFAGDGNDTIYGGPDNTNNDREDTVYGGNGDDIIFGGRYHDSLMGESGNDTIFGQYHNDTIRGGDGDDIIDGGLNDDRLFGDEGNDRIHGGTNHDRIWGGAGDDWLQGDANNDTIYGGSGRNIINGGAHTDFLYGGVDEDIFLFSHASHSTGGARDRIYDFDQGTDKIDLSLLGITALADLTLTPGGWTRVEHADSGLRIDLNGNVVLDADDFIFTPPSADGDILDQTVTVGNAFSVTLQAGHFTTIDDGNLIYDIFLADGNALPGWLSFDTGTLTLSGTPATAHIGTMDILIRATNAAGDQAEDAFTLSVGENLITGTPNADALTGTADADIILGLEDDDTLEGGADADAIFGDAGADSLRGGDQSDTLNGGDGDDYLNGDRHSDVLDGGIGNDTLIGGWNTDGNDHHDTLYGGAGEDYLHGGRNHDRLYAGSEDDTAIGGHGNDSIFGGTGNDWLEGVDGNDIIYGESGSNVIIGGTGTDYLYGGTDDDLFVYTNTNESQGGGRDRVYNFTQGTDRFDFSLIGWAGIGDLNIIQGGWTRIEHGASGFRIDVQGNIALNANDFIFSVPAADGDHVRETATTGNLFTLGLLGGHFASIDNGSLTYSATLDDGSVLPPWLSLDNATGTFSGTPLANNSGFYTILLRGTNSAGDVAEDSFELVVADSSINGTAGADNINGTADNDGIMALADHDTITAGDGNDVILAEGGNDHIDAGTGNDTAYGGNGSDSIQGWNGRDLLDGGDGNDILIGGPANNNDYEDTLYGGGGDDYLAGGHRNDRLYGQAGNDRLDGGVHTDYLYGGADHDLLHGFNNRDQLRGDAGDDTLIGGHDRDSLWGGGGDDIFMITRKEYSWGGNRDILYDFTQGEDRIDLSLLPLTFADLTLTPGGTTRIDHTQSDMRIDIQSNVNLLATDFIFASDIGTADILLADQQAEVGDAVSLSLPGGMFASIDDGNLTYMALEADGTMLPGWMHIDRTTGTLTGTPGNGDAGAVEIMLRAMNAAGTIAEDRFYFAVSDDTTTGLVGDDVLAGDNNANAIRGENGNDNITGGNGNDALYGGLLDDTIDGGNHNDFIMGGSGNDSINGGLRADLIDGGAGNDTIYGGPDNTNNDREDTIYGGSGDDWIHGGRYHDILYGNDGNDTLIGGVHNDSLMGGAGNDSLDGSGNNDWLYGNAGEDTLQGGNNNDRLYGGADADSLHGGNNNDRLYGQDGHDELLGDAGNDFLYGNDGNDSLTGGTGRDSLWGGGGNDHFIYTATNESGGGNRDRIYGFTQGDDVIDLTAFGLAGIGDLTITDNGSITTVEYNALAFQLDGVIPLIAGDFLF